MPIASKPQNSGMTRVEPLACLPVFFSLSGQRAIVAGGTDAAAWKAELLAAAGADVAVVAPVAGISEEMMELAAHGAAAGSIELIYSDWRAADLSGAALVVGDIPEEEAPAFVALARRAGVPVNVIDKPDFCDFQFGSIVNRSPVVVGISTHGAAPVVGQAVRRRVEAVLPPLLGRWGAIAQDIRSRVMARLAPGAERRAFWERFVDLAFGQGPDRRAAARLLRDVANGTDRRHGRVSDVVLTSGALEDLTLGAVRLLQAADIIVHDADVPADVLELARREARRLSSGETGSGSIREKIAEGAHVVRVRFAERAEMPDLTMPKVYEPA